MDRAIPAPGNEEIELYIKTYFSLLRSSGAVRVKALEETHAAMRSSLHAKAESHVPDTGAFTYTVLRLPPVIAETELVIMAQSEEVFERRGYYDVDSWQSVDAPARRRKMFYDGDGTLAAFIASVSDIDDLIPMLTAFQIEWNKMYTLLNTQGNVIDRLQAIAGGAAWTLEDEAALRNALRLEPQEWEQLCLLFEEQLAERLLSIATARKDLRIMLLASSLTDYRRATQGWWHRIATEASRAFIADRSVYFVSSNTHSIVNLLGGYALAHEDKLVAFLQRENPEGLGEACLELDARDPERSNLLYYALRYFLTSDDGASRASDYRRWNRALGFQQIDNPLYLDDTVQVFELNKLDPQRMDPRVRMPGLEALKRSDAIIFNVDYPLGMAAYQILSEVTTRVGRILGVYVMGKAATLNGRIGDVMIPSVVYDEHSQNSYLFHNCFSAQDVVPYMLRSSVLDNQKAVTVRGTFLQNREFMHVFYKESYTDIEMEAGPYLSAIYENNYPKRFPVNEIVNLFNATRYDIGILHYASDTPYSKRQALLADSLSYQGVEATYATSVAIIRRIFEMEVRRIQE